MSKNKSKKDRVLKKKSGGSPVKIIVAVGSAVAVAVIAVVLITAGGEKTVSKENVQQSGTEVMFSTELFNDGNAKYFEQEFSNKTVRYFLVQSGDGVVRAAFDACDVCYRSKLGYSQVGNLMVCNNCGQSFPSELINVEKGGCNPAPLDREVRGGNVVIQIADIEQGLRLF